MQGHRTVKFGTESRIMFTRTKEEWLLNGGRVSVWVDKEVLGVDGGDSHTAM